MSTIEVVVLGGGYAGVMAANRLTRRRDVVVTLVNAREEFVERIRLHQLTVGNRDARRSPTAAFSWRTVGRCRAP